jgi:hypothetical protein
MLIEAIGRIEQMMLLTIPLRAEGRVEKSNEIIPNILLFLAF